jgi:predicted nucleotidyltransferase
MPAQSAIPTRIDPVLLEFRDAVARHFGSRLERIVLYGSRARGDARPDSDYDVAIFVRDLGNTWREFKSLAQLTIKLLAERDVEINASLYPAGHWQHGSSPLMHEIRNDGLDI